MITILLEAVVVLVQRCVKNVGDSWNALVASCNYSVKHMDLKNISSILVVVVVCIAGFVIKLQDV